MRLLRSLLTTGRWTSTARWRRSSLALGRRRRGWLGARREGRLAGVRPKRDRCSLCGFRRVFLLLPGWKQHQACKDTIVFSSGSGVYIVNRPASTSVRNAKTL